MVVAELLAARRRELAGSVIFAFQPNEEGIGGAREMLTAGFPGLDAANAAVAFHLWNYLPLGKIGVRAGPMWASADEVTLVVRGKGGHGAMPHLAVDPVVVASQIVVAAQTLVSRETSPLDPAVLTFGVIRGGTAFNIIAETVTLEGTIRAFNQEVREQLVRRIEEQAALIAAALRADLTFTRKMGCPPIVNDQGVTDLVRRAAAELLGPEGIVEMPPLTVSDDFSYFLERVPGCYFLVGSANPARGLDKPHHHPEFDFDEDALTIAAEVVLRTIGACLGG